MDIVVALLLFICVLIFIPGVASRVWRALLVVLSAISIVLKNTRDDD